MSGKAKVGPRHSRRAQNSAERGRKKAVKARRAGFRVKRRRGSKGRPFQPGNPWRFEKGRSGNPGGRPRLLSDAYREWLETANDAGITNAALVAIRAGKSALSGSIQSAKELRQATEGDILRIFENMTDAELDEFIEERTRRIRAGAPDEGAAPSQAPGTGTGAERAATG